MKKIYKQREIIDEKIDHKIINFAVMDFLRKGGKIAILPPQKSSSKTVIGREKWTAFETLEDILM